MKISPSIASGNLFELVAELDYIDRYFNQLHLDIEDGNAVPSISFGLKLAKQICDYSKSSEKSIHLEVLHPLNFIEQVKACKADIVFIQADCLQNPAEVIRIYQQAGICTGVNLSNLDLYRPDLKQLLAITDSVLINTTHHDDPQQICDLEMIAFALRLAEEGKKVWIDGGVTAEIYHQIKETKLYAAVMGRAIFADRKKAIEQYSILV